MYVSPINYNNQLTLVLFVFPCSIDRNSNMEAVLALISLSTAEEVMAANPEPVGSVILRL